MLYLVVVISYYFTKIIFITIMILTVEKNDINFQYQFFFALRKGRSFLCYVVGWLVSFIEWIGDYYCTNNYLCVSFILIKSWVCTQLFILF
jgi:hypothetical protein